MHGFGQFDNLSVPLVSKIKLAIMCFFREWQGIRVPFHVSCLSKLISIIHD